MSQETTRVECTRRQSPIALNRKHHMPTQLEQHLYKKHKLMHSSYHVLYNCAPGTSLTSYVDLYALENWYDLRG